MVKATFAALSLALIAPVGLAANTIDVQFTGTALGQNIRIIVDASALDVFAGEITHQFTNGVGSGAVLSNTSQNTFCTDLSQHVTSVPLTYDIVDVQSIPIPAMGAGKAQAVFDIYARLITVRGEGFNNDLAAGFQIAVWEIVKDYDPGIGRSSADITSGFLQAEAAGGGAISAAISDAANAFLDAIGSGASGEGLLGLFSGSAQDQIAMIPAPMGAGLGALAMGGLLRRRRR